MTTPEAWVIIAAVGTMMAYFMFIRPVRRHISDGRAVEEDRRRKGHGGW